MVLKPDILAKAIDAVAPADDGRPKILMSPRGKPLTQGRVRQLAAGPGVVIVCGRFEGVDQRVIDGRALEEISIGDYVLAGGEVAACVVIEAVTRLVPGVMGNEASAEEESFGVDPLLEGPQWTRPADFRGWEVPEVLRSGDHARIARWRHAQALHRVVRDRPDLLAERGGLTPEEVALLESTPAVAYPGSSPDVAQEHRAP